MGLLIVIVVGAVLGWLAATAVERHDRVGATICSLAGTVGSVAAAEVAGGVPLSLGVSAAQVLWGAVGAMLAIAAINAFVVGTLGAEARNI